MNVLILSLDQSLLNQSGVGDSLDRFRSYAHHLTNLTVFIPTTNQSTQPSSNSNINLVAVASPHKLLAYLKLIYLTRRASPAPDLIVTNDPILGLIALLSRLPSKKPKVQINVFGLPLFNTFWYRSRPLNLIYAPFYLIALKLADGIRTDNQTDRRQLIQKLSLNPQHIAVVPVPPSSAIQNQLIKSLPDSRLKHRLAGTNQLVLSAGSITPRKGFDTLITAAGIVLKSKPQTTFLLVGSGEDLSTLKLLAQSLHIADRIIFKPETDYHQLLKYYRLADIFVLSSHLEGLPRVLMEAALSRTPIVTTATAGALDLIVDRESGRIVPINQPEALAQAILDTLSDPQSAQKAAKRSYQKALRYLDFDHNTRLLVKSWRTLIETS